MQILNMEAFPKKQNVGYTGAFFLFPKTADKIVCGSAHLLNTPMHPKMYPACNSASSREHPTPQMCPKCHTATTGEHPAPQSVPQIQCLRLWGTPAALFVPEWTFLILRGTHGTPSVPQQEAKICREENGHRQKCILPKWQISLLALILPLVYAYYGELPLKMH